MQLAAMNVDVNHWLGFTILFLLRVILPGAAWSWVIPPSSPERERGWTGWILAAGRTALLGTLGAVLSTWLLAELGLYTRMIEWALTALWIAAGVLLGRRTEWGRQLAVFAFFAVALAGLMLLPKRGEWIAGGWDPGTYVNQGIAVSRTGSARPAPDPTFSLFSAEELRLFTREVYNFTEAYPVVPIDPEQRSLQPFFFHLMPGFIALLDRCGGLRAATRANEFAGLLGLVIFASFMVVLLPRRSEAAFAVLALVIQPVWLYHLHIPTSEMLQWLLLCGMGMILPARHAGAGARGVLLLLLFAAVLNRFTFLPFGGLLLCVLAWLDLDRDDRRLVARARIAQVAALTAGALCDLTASSLTVGRLFFAVPSLLAGFVVTVVAAVAVDVLGGRPAWRAALGRWLDRWILGLGFAGFLLVLVLAFPVHLAALREFRYNVRLVTWYLGGPLLLVALLGIVVSAARASAEYRTQKAWCAFLLAAAVASLLSSVITTLWPWAARRHVEFTMPLLAILSGVALGGLWSWGDRRSRVSKAIVVLAALGLVAATGTRSWKAWSCTEFDGASAVLEKVAAQIEPNDIVVADQFRWGTPLRFIYGKRILNGELFHAEPGSDRMRRALAALDRLRGEGYRIRFLTSTADGMGVFPEPVEPVTRDWTAPPFLLRDLAHSSDKPGFRMRERTKEFGLFTWK